MRNIPLRIIIAVVTAATTLYAYVHIAIYLDIPDPVWMSCVVLAVVCFHEMCHLIAYERHGVACMFFFAVVLGGTVPIDMKREARLDDEAEAEVALAGLLGNMAIGVGATLLYGLGFLSMVHMERIVNLNAALIIFNLIPIGPLDGSKFIKLLFHNVAPRIAAELFSITSVGVLIGIMILLYWKGAIILSLPLILFGLERKLKHHAEDPSTRVPMSKEARFRWAWLFVFLVLFAVVGFGATPNWAHP